MPEVTLESVNPTTCSDIQWQNYREAALKNARESPGYMNVLTEVLGMRFNSGGNTRVNDMLKQLLAEEMLVGAGAIKGVGAMVAKPKNSVPQTVVEQIVQECEPNEKAQVCLVLICAFTAYKEIQTAGIHFGKAKFTESPYTGVLKALPPDVKYCLIELADELALPADVVASLRTNVQGFIPVFELIGHSACTSDKVMQKELFDRIKPTAADVAQCISIIHTKKWEPATLGRALRTVVNEGFTWPDILREYSNLPYVSQDAKVFLAVFQAAMERKMNISIACEYGIKLSLLLKFSQESSNCDFSTLHMQDAATLHGNEPWKSIDYVEALINSVNTPTDATYLKSSLEEGPIMQCPGVLLVSLCEVSNRPRHFVEILSTALYAVLKNADPQIIQAVNLSPETILKGLAELQVKDVNCCALLIPVVPVIVMHKLLEACSDLPMFVRLLMSSYEKDPGATMEWTKGVMNGTIPIKLDQPISNAVAQLPQHITARLTDVLDNVKPSLSLPPMSNDQDIADQALVLPTEEWPQDVEEGIQDFMTKLFQETLGIPPLIDVVKEWKRGNRGEYHCLIYQLLRELCYIKDFPDRELKLMSSLFGNLVKHDLMSPDKLQFALHFVLRILKVSQNENERRFCLIALDIFRDRLSEWPNYCENLKSVSHLEQLIPGISVSMRPDTANPTAIHQLDISSLTRKPEDEMVVPPPHVIEKCGFIVNNLDLAKMQQSIEDLKDLLKPEFFPYFANYLIVKRISLEPNFHKLYQKMLDNIKDRDLDNHVTQASYRAVRTLLASQKISTNSSERSLLKNLGAWIGLQTLARNRSLLARELNLKDLLMTAMEQGKLIAVAPFVSKILEHAAESKVFRPPNPWLMGILEVMVDIHQLPDIKLTLKFEVEVLCKTLGLKISDLIGSPKSVDLRRSQQKTKLEEMWSRLNHTNNSDFHVTQPSPTPPQQEWPDEPADMEIELSPHPLPPVPQHPQPQVLSQQPQQQPQHQPATSQHQMKPNAQEWYPNRQMQMSQQAYASPPSWEQREPSKPKPSTGITVPQEYASGPHVEIMREAVLIALHESVTNLQESQSLPQRAATTAVRATAELVFKDFIVESDDMLVYEAAEGVVTVLANQLAMVQAKGGLTGTMMPKIVEFLKRVFSEAQATEVANKLTAENLHLGVTAICNTTKARALEGIKLELERHLRDRNNFRSKGGWIEGMKASDIFRRLMPGATQEQIERVATLKEPLLPFPMLHMHRELYKSFRNFEDIITDLEEVFNDIKRNLELHFKESRDQLSLTQLEFGQQDFTAHHVRVRELVKGIPIMLRKLGLGEILRIVGWSCKELFKYTPEASQAHMHMGTEIAVFLTEVCLFVLQDLVKSHPEEVKAEATMQFLNCEKRWSLKETARNFIGLKLLDMEKLDDCLARELRASSKAGMAPTVEFVRVLVQKCVIDEKLVQQSDFKQSLGFLQEAVRKQRENSIPQRPIVRVPSLVAFQTDGHVWRERVLALFYQQLALYVKKCQGVDKPQEETLILTKLQQAGLLQENHLDKFLSLLVEVGIEHFATIVHKAGVPKYERQEAGKLKTGGRPAAEPPKPPVCITDQPELFRGVDASCELIFRLIKGCSWRSQSEDGTAGLHLVKKVVTVVTAVLVNNHDFHSSRGSATWINMIDKDEQPQKQFMQQPYFRLFSNLLGNLAYIIPKGSPNEVELMKAFLNHFCEMLRMIIPSKVPGFAFAWLDLVSHRVLLPKLIQYNSDAYLRLLSAGVVFLSPALKTAEFNEPQRLFYKGLLKVFMVINHDFPLFLYKYFVPLSTVIPRNCFQLRNVVLSARPKGVKPPDYHVMYTKDMGVLPVPKLVPEYVEAQMTEGALQVDSFDRMVVEGVADRRVCEEVVALLVKHPPEDSLETDPVYDLKLINALIARGATVCTDSSVPEEEKASRGRNMLQLINGLLALLPIEGKYHLISSMANHLRDVNAHTYLFGKMLLTLFKTQDDEVVQELIVSVLVERTLEHTTLFLWGVLGTLSELLRNEEYVKGIEPTPQTGITSGRSRS
eukprot:TRINITY_DN19646_c0_g1_i2.p1 TRINITY_DN19646_c0_g1~~TRINITY_DN19646_c0_g1_i2.p1  ORF type:complete len:2034 (+),score=692.67 TRINITY_DN19646_c0_g1_i2:84-6185(+)